ncbi:MAG TPA: SRPBCC family protein [Longimicrobiales bacterium]|nr:SRPBCC family protein [Longimicrobiales bacterium]
MTTTPTSSSDRIEEQVVLDAPRARVWRALTNADELGAWFGANLAGSTIAPGARVTGHITSPGYEHVVMDLLIEELVPERRFSWRWHPAAIEPGVDYSAEPRTLVTFTLEDAADGGTLLRVVESGFAALPEARRATAFLGNSKGWAGQLQKRLPAYLAAA